MTQHEALEVLARHRGDRIVISSMTAVGIWPQLSDTPLDFAYLPSSMGQAPALGLGLAMAQRRGVVVISGDGSMLMNLGCLVTMANHPADLFVVILDNGLYEVTGGQSTAGKDRVDFAGMAKAAGIQRVHRFANLDDWKSGAQQALAGPGPGVIVLAVEGRLGQKTPKAPRAMDEQIKRLREALA